MKESGSRCEQDPGHFVIKQKRKAGSPGLWEGFNMEDFDGRIEKAAGVLKWGHNIQRLFIKPGSTKYQAIPCA